jgi:prevent-host-death family protein
MEVSIKELRADLSRFIKRVREGEEIVVTDRGKAVARIVPLDGQRKIDRLIAAGVVKPAKRRTNWLPEPIKAEGTISDLIER